MSKVNIRIFFSEKMTMYEAKHQIVSYNILADMAGITVAFLLFIFNFRYFFLYFLLMPPCRLRLNFIYSKIQKKKK